MSLTALAEHGVSLLVTRSGGNETLSASAVEHASHSSGIESSLLFVILCVLIGSLVKSYLASSVVPELAKPPYTLMLFLLGFAFGTVAHLDNFLSHAFAAAERTDPHLILFMLLPPLLYESAVGIRFHVLWRVKEQVIILASVGVIIALVLTTIIFRYVFVSYSSWSLSHVLLLSSILCATDPVAVVAALKELGAPATLSTLIEGESLLNDGSAFVLFLLFKDMAGGVTPTFWSVVGQFLQLVLGGVLFGVLTSILVFIWLKIIYNHPLIEIPVILVGVFGTFYVAEALLHVSGVLATVMFGFMMSNRFKYTLSPAVIEMNEAVWTQLAHIAETVIFVMGGIIVYDKIINHGDLASDYRHWLWLLLLYLVLHLVRATMVGLLEPLLRQLGYGFTFKQGAVLTYGGLRGAVSLTLGLLVESDLNIDRDVRFVVNFHVAGIVFMTLFINGWTTSFVYNKLQLYPPDRFQRAILRKTIEYLEEYAEREWSDLKHEWYYADADWPKVRAIVPDFRNIQMSKTSPAFSMHPPSISKIYKSMTPAFVFSTLPSHAHGATGDDGGSPGSFYDSSSSHDRRSSRRPPGYRGPDSGNYAPDAVPYSAVPHSGLPPHMNESPARPGNNNAGLTRTGSGAYSPVAQGIATANARAVGSGPGGIHRARARTQGRSQGLHGSAGSVPAEPVAESGPTAEGGVARPAADVMGAALSSVMDDACQIAGEEQQELLLSYSSASSARIPGVDSVLAAATLPAWHGGEHDAEEQFEEASGEVPFQVSRTLRPGAAGLPVYSSYSYSDDAYSYTARGQQWPPPGVTGVHGTGFAPPENPSAQGVTFNALARTASTRELKEDRVKVRHSTATISTHSLRFRETTHGTSADTMSMHERAKYEAQLYQTYFNATRSHYEHQFEEGIIGDSAMHRLLEAVDRASECRLNKRKSSDFALIHPALVEWKFIKKTLKVPKWVRLLARLPMGWLLGHFMLYNFVWNRLETLHGYVRAHEYITPHFPPDIAAEFSEVMLVARSEIRDFTRRHIEISTVAQTLMAARILLQYKREKIKELGFAGAFTARDTEQLLHVIDQQVDTLVGFHPWPHHILTSGSAVSDEDRGSLPHVPSVTSHRPTPGSGEDLDSDDEPASDSGEAHLQPRSIARLRTMPSCELNRSSGTFVQGIMYSSAINLPTEPMPERSGSGSGSVTYSYSRPYSYSDYGSRSQSSGRYPPYVSHDDSLQQIPEQNNRSRVEDRLREEKNRGAILPMPAT
ncbi:cyclic nucleotide-binding protein [Thecamonas trahens ATCC 50062]|uniref:Cyclic nucleotide-binding protein n=1 Tax=Thecamonas trahens ATCC 50062 TaxID=461836 RepID=A0A0L0DSN3_THETB|nr:cyclic nucleotide-binding protein [Thecamonas trahens ATCC 50062]KNC55217.1 cyclic nucleotide-binding protein [Thecamonas trahens ATCC 50062]|eukprot:XP_013753147.1 cyclic nucleotide-binding protein [Thecamonas trahens ATCC 50062]